MPGREADFKVCDSLWNRFESLASALARYKARNVNSAGLRQQARDVVIQYFREVRPALQRLGVGDATTEALDFEMQHLVGLATGRNSKASYLKSVRGVRSKRKNLETGLEFLIGAEKPVAKLRIGNVETSILFTLETMLPSAAASYGQVLADVQETNRISYRGTAAELREVVREVLDHLAPDADVINAPGFKLEASLKGPSMKQKVRFILRARKTGDSARQTAEDSVRHLDDNVGSIGRAVYARGSTDLHTSRPLEEIRNFKLYADAVLGELLAIHRPAGPGAQRIPGATQEVQPATAARITVDKKEILTFVLKVLATRFEEGNRHRATFTPSTPEETKPLLEVLAALRAEGSVNELAGTYQFTPEGYVKYKRAD
jgi:Predicted pPIWI-associating nuclease